MHLDFGFNFGVAYGHHRKQGLGTLLIIHVLPSFFQNILLLSGIIAPPGAKNYCSGVLPGLMTPHCTPQNYGRP